MAAAATSDVTDPKPGGPLVYALDFSKRVGENATMAVGTFMTEQGDDNATCIVDFDIDSGRASILRSFRPASNCPPIQIQYAPAAVVNSTELLAVGACGLEIWGDSLLQQYVVPPITGFDWAETTPELIGTSCKDGSFYVCHLQAAGKSARVVAGKSGGDFGNGFVWVDRNVFVVGSWAGESSKVSMYDTRATVHPVAAILTADSAHMGRPCLNEEKRFLAVANKKSNNIDVADMRRPGRACMELVTGTDEAVNALAWAPNTGHTLYSVGDDKRLLSWNLSVPAMVNPSAPGDTLHVISPGEVMTAREEINYLCCSCKHPNVVAMSVGTKVEVVRTPA